MNDERGYSIEWSTDTCDAGVIYDAAGNWVATIEGGEQRINAILDAMNAALPQPEQPEAGRDEYHRCGKNIRRHNVSECQQTQEAVAWRCDECGCTSRERIDEQQPDGSFAPGPSFRCVECKKESHPPTNAEAVRLLARLVAIANERPFVALGHVLEHEVPAAKILVGNSTAAQEGL